MISRNRPPLLLLLLLLMLAAAVSCAFARQAGPGRVPVIRAPRRPPEEKILGRLPAQMDAAGEEVFLSVLVDLRRQVDLYALASRMDRKGLGKAERRAWTVAALEEVAREGAATLEPFLTSLAGEGLVEEYEQFAIVNRYHVSARPEGVHRLAGHRAVATLRWGDDRHIAFPAPQPELPALSGPSSASVPEQAPQAGHFSWGLEAMGATRLWEQGLSGEGVLVAALDTGAEPAHEQLRDSYRGGEDSWLDPVGGETAPLDYVDHGTRVLGCVVGSNKGDRVCGAAPGARWIGGVVLPRGWFHHVALTAVADWILRTAQPDVIVNSWFTGSSDCDPYHDGILGAWRVAEIFVVFGAGNRGPNPSSGGTPANTAVLPPDGGPAFSVGAVDREEVVTRRSSRGPSQCGGRGRDPPLQPRAQPVRGHPPPGLRPRTGDPGPLRHGRERVPGLLGHLPGGRLRGRRGRPPARCLPRGARGGPGGRPQGNGPGSGPAGTR